MGAGNNNQKNKKLRVLVITLGGERRKYIEEMFADPVLAESFEAPVFSEGVSSRSIRNRIGFFRAAHKAGLLPIQEWEAISSRARDENEHPERFRGQRTESFFDCLDTVPVTTGGRRGSSEDVKLHYSVELWRKAKGINRGRSVLACVFAHLIAIQRFVDANANANAAENGDGAAAGGFDLILEDNVRTPPRSCAGRVRAAAAATRDWENSSPENGRRCHFRFVGWLGSIPNLEWILGTHVPKRKHNVVVRNNKKNNNGTGEEAEAEAATVCPLPRLEDLDEDVAANGVAANEPDGGGGDDNETEPGEMHQHRQPGGNLLWGAYAYWISGEAHGALMETLRTDVGALLWKSKRMRNYAVKPIDKILPRRISELFGHPGSVQIVTHPAFFRAPMLTSKIHTKWDPGFCDSTDRQLTATGLAWSDLWLTPTERAVVEHHEHSGTWCSSTAAPAEQPPSSEEQQPRSLSSS